MNRVNWLDLAGETLYFVWDELNVRHPTIIFKIHFNFSSYLHLGLPRGPSLKVFACVSDFFHITYMTPCEVILMMLGERSKLWSFKSRNFLMFSVASSWLRRNILLRTLFCNPYACVIPLVRETEVTCNISYIFKFLDKRLEGLWNEC
jgi:hypothetical protein